MKEYWFLVMRDALYTMGISERFHVGGKERLWELHPMYQP